MKKLFTLGLALLGGALAAQAQLTPSGGPDSYGYTWKTSAAPGGPTYRWVDITTRGTLVNGLADDNLAPGSVSMPFAFPYYFGNFRSFKIGSNGYISFEPRTALSQPFPTIPFSDRGAVNAAFAAAYLSDLNFAPDVNAPGIPNPARCYYYVNADSAVVSFINVPFWESATPDFRGSNTFQIILTRADGAITFQYQDIDPQQPTPGTNSPNQVVVGIEDLSQTIGLQAGLNQLPTNGSAVRFSRPGSTTLQFTDVGPDYFVSPDNGAFFALLNQPFTPQVNVGSYGNQPAGSFPTSIRIQNRPGQSASPLYNQSVTLGGLPAQADSMLMFQPYTPSTTAPSAGTGVFRVSVTTNLSGDQNASNNTIRTMFAVVDTTGTPEHTLSYDDEAANGIVGFGAGVYFKPLYYPAEIVGTEAPILGFNPTSSTSFTIKVLADDGPNGTAGTELFSDTLAQNDVTVGAVNSLTIANPIRINSGGFYITWVPNVIDSTFVGEHGPTAQNPSLVVPISNRNFEVIGGVLSPYRSSDQNIMISAIMKTRVAGSVGLSHDRSNTLAFRSVFPNPSAERATISYSVKQSAPVTLTVTDLLGRPVRTLALGQPAAGEHQYELNVQDLPAGLYLCSLRAGNATLTQKMVVQH